MKTIDTKITTEWGVKWSPFEIARDFLQNFYDDNPVGDITVSVKGDKVTVSAPKEFDPQLLDYLVSFKGEGKIGRYGEGFKAATLNALRDHGCRVLLDVSGEQREWYLEEKQLGGRSTRVVMCRISSSKVATGTRLLLDHCPQVLADEFRRGLTFFYYPENPLFGSALAGTYEKDIFAYRSSDDRGYVFYGKLLRAVLDAPIVLVCNRPYKKIDEKIQYDRDRKAFTHEVLDDLLNLMMKNLTHRAAGIIEVLKLWWVPGHKVLAALAKAPGIAAFRFPPNYYARSGPKHWDTVVLTARIKRVEEEFQQKGYLQCPAYMADLGMTNARSVIESGDARRKALHSKIHLRKPDKLEQQGLNILRSYVESIHPSLASVYATAKYTIGSSDEVLGELREKDRWRSTEVYLARQVFHSSFADAVSVLLHEWAHVHGFDGSRDFTDALTEAIAVIIQEKGDVARFEREWEEVRSKIQAQDGVTHRGVYEYVEQLTNKEKNKLLRGLPEEELLRLVSDAELDAP